MSSIWVSQNITGNRKHAAAGAVDGVMSAEQLMMTVWFYGSIFSRKPAVFYCRFTWRRGKSRHYRAAGCGQANSHLVKFLGKQFRVAKTRW